MDAEFRVGDRVQVQRGAALAVEMNHGYGGLTPAGRVLASGTTGVVLARKGVHLALRLSGDPTVKFVPACLCYMVKGGAR